MEKKEKGRQTILRLAFGISILAFALIIEMVAIHPSGLYSYTQKDGYREFDMGISKAQVLKRINKRKTLREIKTCNPEKFLLRTTRKGIELAENLLTSDFWFAYDRTGKIFLFVFKDNHLAHVLIQRLRFGKMQGSVLFSSCDEDKLYNLDQYLEKNESLSVFYDTDA